MQKQKRRIESNN